MLRAARAKFALTSAPSITSTRFQPSPLSACASALVLPSAERRRVEHHQLARRGLGRQRVLQAEGAELLGQVVGVAARRRPLVGAAVAEGRRLARAVPGAAGALLAVDLLGRVADVRTCPAPSGCRPGAWPAASAPSGAGCRRAARGRRSRRRARSSPPGSRRARSRRVSFLVAPFLGGLSGLGVCRRRRPLRLGGLGRLGLGGLDRGLLGLLLRAQRLGLGGGGLGGGLLGGGVRRPRRRTAAPRAGSRCRAWPS